ncbi:PIG-L deacetylase family protein [Nocardioides sp.]|uniref:PIG-L deacetylase family protein n=1 Tax=Nocardioides sp. TaxID=35761 RepID=UPI00271DDBFA|nr:PIG-L family deacetylase [Nocardioides sp.]MDO9457688.1 PIG-L family deacetylase [Nocardioides sp.]
MRSLVPAHCDEVVVLGAHCDDVAIGAGGTLLTWCLARPGLRVRALVLSGAGTPREAEERTALASFCPGADLEVTVLDLPDGRLPDHWNRAKDELETFRRTCEPDLVLAPSTHDNHQDHRGLARLVPTVFRDHLVLGYEILKAEADLAQPLVSVPLTAEVLADKCRLLHAGYPSQQDRTWFDDEVFRGLARLRGVQAGHRYAEGFHPARIVVEPGVPTGAA